MHAQMKNHPPELVQRNIKFKRLINLRKHLSTRVSFIGRGKGGGREKEKEHANTQNIIAQSHLFTYFKKK